MLPRARGKNLFCVFAIAFLLCSFTRVHAQNVNPVLLRESVSQSNRRELTEKLRRITGWSNLTFDANGALQTGIEQTEGGSQTARALLLKAISGTRLIVVDDVSNSEGVAFGSVTPGRWDQSAAHKPEAYVVMIDFADFQQVIGDKRARESFDAGWAMLHEIDHAINDSQDPSVPGEVGDCEEHINVMRRELMVPERREYFHALVPASNASLNFPTTFVRLAFEARDNANKKKRYWLMWNTAAVGGPKDSRVLAAVR
jgi:hypothetical protein